MQWNGYFVQAVKIERTIKESVPPSMGIKKGFIAERTVDNFLRLLSSRCCDPAERSCFLCNLACLSPFCPVLGSGDSKKELRERGSVLVPREKRSV